MRGTFIVFMLAFTIAVSLFASLVIHSLQTIEPGEVPDVVRLGKQVWQDKACVECHTILGHGGYFGPDLTDVVPERGIAWLRDFFREPPILPAAKEKRHMSLALEEAEPVIQFLVFIAKIKKTEDWPPRALFSTGEGR